MRKAFLLGAGLGTRLKPLTDTLPKPLIPLENRPLITHAMDHLIKAGIVEIAINTHHLPEAWPAAFPDATYRGASLSFFYEPDLLETGGGHQKYRRVDGKRFHPRLQWRHSHRPPPR